MGNLVKEVTVSEMVATLEALAARGVTKDRFDLIRKDSRHADGVAQAMIGAPAKTSMPGPAYRIIVNHHILPTDVMARFGVQYSDKDLKSLEKIPWDAKTRRKFRDTHILFPTFPLSILEMKAKAPAGLFHEQDWYNGHAFAHSERPEVRWHLIRKDRVPNSTNKTYSQQMALLSNQEENPPAVVLAQLMVIYHMMTGTKLYTWEKNDGVRSSSLSSDGGRVYVLFYGGQLHVDYWYDGDSSDSYLGLAASRKFPRT